jgi:hypothetical protein
MIIKHTVRLYQIPMTKLVASKMPFQNVGGTCPPGPQSTLRPWLCAGAQKHSLFVLTITALPNNVSIRITTWSVLSAILWASQL